MLTRRDTSSAGRIEIYKPSNDTWEEHSITALTASPAGSLVTQGDVAARSGVEVELDVTEYSLQKLEEDKRPTIILGRDIADSFLDFQSKKNGAGPVLRY